MKLTTSEISSYCELWAENPEALREYLSGFHAPTGPIVEIVGPCGSKIEYATIADIPDINVPCPCGNERHWVVKYGGAS